MYALFFPISDLFWLLIHAVPLFFLAAELY